MPFDPLSDSEDDESDDDESSVPEELELDDDARRPRLFLQDRFESLNLEKPKPCIMLLG